MSDHAEPTRWQRIAHTPLRDVLRGRLTGRLDVDRELRASGLPEPAQALIGRVVRRTRLWRLEQADVAQELIAHFQDGVDAGTAVDEVIDAFGDEKAAAKLIRRAKRRNRPLAWRVLQWTIMGIAAVVLLYALTTLWLLTERSDVSVDYVAVMNREALAVPEEARAWPIYREAIVRYGLTEDEALAALMSDDGREMLRPGDAGWAGAAAFLRERAPLLAMVREAAARPSLGLPVGHRADFAPEDAAVFWGDELHEVDLSALTRAERLAEESLIGVLLPQLGQMRRLARLLESDAVLAAEEGDAERVAADIAALHGLARHARENPTLIADLVAHSIVAMALRSASRALADRPALFSDEQLVALAHRLLVLDDFGKVQLSGERLMMLDTLQRVYSDDGRVTAEGLAFLRSIRDPSSDGTAVATASEFAPLALPLANLAIAPRAEMRREFERLMAMLEARARLPMWERLAKPSPVEARVDGLRDSPLQRTRYFLIVELFPAVEAAIDVGDRTLAIRDALQAAIAIELYRREHDAYPSSWGALVPRYLPEVPVDRSTGEPLLFRVAEGEVVIYGRGLDGDDDGGVMGEEARKRWPHVPEAGDWVLHPPPGE